MTLRKLSELMDEYPGPSQQSGLGFLPGSSDNDNPQDGESLVKMERSTPITRAPHSLNKKRIEKPRSENMVAYEDIIGLTPELKDLLNVLVTQHGGEQLEDGSATQFKKFPRVNYHA